MCCYCGREISRREIYRNSTCDFCGKDLKICLNCLFYEPGRQWDCKESISEPVRDKDRPNFCDYFSPRRSFSGPKDKGADRNTEAKEAFHNLFGDE